MYYATTNVHGLFEVGSRMPGLAHVPRKVVRDSELSYTTGSWIYIRQCTVCVQRRDIALLPSTTIAYLPFSFLLCLPRCAQELSSLSVTYLGLRVPRIISSPRGKDPTKRGYSRMRQWQQQQQQRMALNISAFFYTRNLLEAKWKKTIEHTNKQPWRFSKLPRLCVYKNNLYEEKNENMTMAK